MRDCKQDTSAPDEPSLKMLVMVQIAAGTEGVDGVEVDVGFPSQRPPVVVLYPKFHVQPEGKVPIPQDSPVVEL
jgi:hypothetical protein